MALSTNIFSYDVVETMIAAGVASVDTSSLMPKAGGVFTDNVYMGGGSRMRLQNAAGNTVSDWSNDAASGAANAVLRTGGVIRQTVSDTGTTFVGDLAATGGGIFGGRVGAGTTDPQRTLHAVGAAPARFGLANNSQYIELLQVGSGVWGWLTSGGNYAISYDVTNPRVGIGTNDLITGETLIVGGSQRLIPAVSQPGLTIQTPSGYGQYAVRVLNDSGIVTFGVNAAGAILASGNVDVGGDLYASAASGVIWRGAGTFPWRVYTADSTDLYFRDSVHGRMHASFVQGSNATIATTYLDSRVVTGGVTDSGETLIAPDARINGLVKHKPPTSAPTLGAGFAAMWMDATAHTINFDWVEPDTTLRRKTLTSDF